ncbi:haloacid dehalogenase superfamily, subfamily IA, variant 3 with third motif having DD or ED [Geodermatophilus saharensis]|uniref:Haloacid dehalogenase superfamily, subfamily IA, variant 3 with third motif having DD or ED n=1 Tax=Geodermatophilus saharensis TaxID=1137994 RepID=A0A239IXL0_9ACTN|nr:HAD family phosphatase [Geodermatophilus saharensis]SNS97763.1 haloacid dehalogenase superfamily, subfamily IA, variant 3 with third motif having DD or ED [Geodermatophilus saharensis]
MSAPTLDPAAVTTLLCDADGTLFPSEEPAYAASADVTNRFLAGLGADRAFAPEELQRMTNGKNFRAAAAELATGYGRELTRADLEDWVLEEKDVVTAHLRTVLRPDPAVRGPLERLAGRFALAAVTSSASSRLAACLEVTGLEALFDPGRRFSAEDSLTEPTSKPDPAVYVYAGATIGVGPAEAVAVEDSVNGARSAVAAGFPTIGLLQFVPEADRRDRTGALHEAGVAVVAGSWSEVEQLLR